MPEPVDDLTIGDSEILLHRVHAQDVSTDPATNVIRPNSSNLRSKTNIMSVDIASMTTPQRALQNYVGHRLVAIDAGSLRSLGCKIVRDPEPSNDAHALVYGSAPDGRMTKGASQANLTAVSMGRKRYLEAKKRRPAEAER